MFSKPPLMRKNLCTKDQRATNASMAGKRKQKKGSSNMWITYTVMFTLFLFCLWMAHSKGLAWEGIKAGASMFKEIFPLLVMAFLLAGIVEKILPKEFMTKWLGEGSGLKGLIMGTLAGALTPGGPFIQFPIVASLLKAGVGVGPAMAYITSWSLLGLNRFFVYEMPLLGLNLSTLRFLVSLFIPVMVGFICNTIWNLHR